VLTFYAVHCHSFPAANEEWLLCTDRSHTLQARTQYCAGIGLQSGRHCGFYVSLHAAWVLLLLVLGQVPLPGSQWHCDNQYAYSMHPTTVHNSDIHLERVSNNGVLKSQNDMRIIISTCLYYFIGFVSITQRLVRIQPSGDGSHHDADLACSSSRQ